MPNLGVFHPQIVHFVIAFLFAGGLLRVVWFFRWKPDFFDHAARWLVVAGTLASVAAVRSGDDAHGPAERVPGARPAVMEHEELGERTRNLFLVVAALELGALALGKRPARRWVTMAAAAAGLGGLLVLYETAEHGGELVYAYAGGVGVRSGESEDVGRLLLAGLYHQAQLDRREGRAEQAARLTEEMARRYPGDRDVQLLAMESLILDRKDARAALTGLAAVSVPLDTPRVRIRHGLLVADAYSLLGLPDSARAVLTQLAAAFPNDQRIRDRLARP
ncbi:MAG TPA: DUF2231 domain-containing protein [Gemmatimonadales bacterium]|nr:DUF2231 domain-containing protein [Gemmatimonadales bacterium]